MEHSEFTINGSFYTATGKWRCTDVGSRIITAIPIEGPQAPRDPSWLNGPPFAIVETVFDEYDFPRCWLNDDEELAKRLEDIENYSEANPSTIPAKEVIFMLRRRREMYQEKDNPYPMRHLRVDRGHDDQRRRAFGAHQEKDGTWIIEVFRYSTQAIEEISERDWLALPLTDFDAPKIEA